MHGTIFAKSKKTAPKSTSTVRRNRFRPQCEAVEDRVVMTSLTGVGGSVPHILPPVPPIVIVPFSPPAQVVNLTTEPYDQVSGILTANTTQYYSFQLQEGDYLQTDLTVEPGPGTLVTADVNVLNASGAVLGTRAPGSPYGFYAPSSGTYYAEVTGTVTGLIPLRAYELDLHRLALAQGPQNVSTLAETGSMYAFLKGNTLDITGPTGYGFGITGNWVESTTTNLLTGQVAASYTATGTLELQSAAGEVPLHLAANAVASLTTAPQINGGIFGAVSSLNLPVWLKTGHLMTPFANTFGFDLNPLEENVTIDITLGGAAGIGLGNSTLLTATQAPLNNAVPYLYFALNPLVTSATSLVSVVFDPADPALFVGGKALAAIPLGPVSVSGIGFSSQGLIPYTPVDAPSQYSGQMSSGDLVLQGSVNTTAITVIPSKINGNITLNLDPNHTGKILGGVDVTAADFTGIFGSNFASVLSSSSSAVAQNLDQIFRNISVGINGTLDINPLASFQQDLSWQIGNDILGLPTGPSSFVDQVLNWADGKLGDPQTLALLPIGDASMIYNGPTESLFFHGGTTNPFAGTPLASLYSLATQAGIAPTLNVDAAVEPGDEFYLNVSGTSNILGLPESGEVILAHDFPVTGPATSFLSASSPTSSVGGLPVVLNPHGPTLYTGIYLDANVHVLGSSVNLQGEMDGSGDFTIQATAQINLGALTGSASFTLSDSQAYGFSFTADMSASFNSEYLRGNVDVDFSFGVDDGHITYAGSVDVSGQVYLTSLIGWVGWNFSGGISNGEIWASADGYEVEFTL
jgi:hypothetical protein